MNRKVQFFRTTSLASFMYDVIDSLARPNDFVFTESTPYLVLPDTDSAAFMFIFIWDLSCSITVDDTWKIIPKILLRTVIKEPSDLPDDFYQILREQNLA